MNPGHKTMSCKHPRRQRRGALAVRRRWSDVAAKAIFANTVHFEAPPQDLMGIKRMPGSAGASAPIDFWSERQGRKVVCESGAELRVFSWLERSPEVRWYQEQPVAVPYTFDGRLAYYYPDAAVLDSAGRLVVVEVKPQFTMYRQDTVAKAIAALNSFGPRGIGYLLVDPGGRTLADLARAGYDRKVAETVEPFFVHGPVPFRLVKNLLRMRCGRFERAAFVSMAINRDWGVTDEPYVRIWKLPDGLSFRSLTRSDSKSAEFSVTSDPVTAPCLLNQ